MNELSIKTEIDHKKIELASLQEITLAINNNLPEESLYKIFYFTLKANLKINKFVVMAHDETWKCKIQYGTQSDFSSQTIPSDILESNSIVYFFNYTGAHEAFSEFHIAIPVAYKNKVTTYIFLAWPDKADLSPDFVPFLRTVSNIILVAIENKKMARNEIEREKIKKELDIARTVQSHLFPKKLANNDHVQMAATYLPHQSVGGDYYDYMQVDKDKFYICVGDVSGKGIPAALTMSNFQASLRTMIRMGLGLRNIIEELNFQLHENTQNGTFITFFIAYIDLKEGLIHYVNAGHNPPIMLFGNGEHFELETGTTILGPLRDLPFVNEGMMDIRPNTTLFLYTDGLTETENDSQQQFGVKYTIEQLNLYKQLSPEEINKNIVQKLNMFKEKNDFADDITLLTCKIN